MRIAIDHNLGPIELIDSLIGLAHAEDIVEPLTKALSAPHREPVREALSA